MQWKSLEVIQSTSRTVGGYRSQPQGLYEATAPSNDLDIRLQGHSEPLQAILKQQKALAEEIYIERVHVGRHIASLVTSRDT